MTTPKDRRQDVRNERLAAALRENLKRRKAQAKPQRRSAGETKDDNRVSPPRGDEPEPAASHAGASTKQTSRT
jgi:hypothetical protein